MAADIFFPILLVCGFFGVLVLFGILMSYVSLRWLHSEMTKCPECGRRGAGEFLDSEVVDSKTYIERGSATTRFFGDAGKQVRITEQTYAEHYRCEHCGHEWTRSAQEKKTTPIK